MKDGFAGGEFGEDGFESRGGDECGFHGKEDSLVSPHPFRKKREKDGVPGTLVSRM